ncbi:MULTISPECIES: 50S ribosomal protein L7/L12 [unclassified Pseudomonas]|uniref:50S ribosomal protein L7/L12 n=1 Tax=unclassified Pseudomonas TaxID=196821 RepID=UPI0011EDC780|nr:MULTISPECIES: 50S ribosomal protein L7/L12 [unclassified Pseudomonas]KAA0944503.1 50S ribosomal protein L7/L12 [Pseudomonas sp. ANT_H4]KAA0951239.1 50S ribosomal protein L7/L12 [Pseudomonas sp. ANT_H14]
MSLTNDQIIEAIGEKSVLEIVELIKAMEEKFGVSAAAASAGPAAAAAVVEEQTEFNVVLLEAGDKKVNVIKAVRELTGLGLKEAKAVVDSGAGSVVLEAVSADAAAKAKATLEEAGAKVELK